jgi:hypothetical protein
VRDDFNNLVSRLKKAGLDINTTYLHGLLTGIATGPDDELDAVWPEIGGDHALSETIQCAVIDVLEILGKELSVGEFRTRFRTDRIDDPKRWINGYVKAVALNEKAWAEANEEHRGAGVALVLLHSFINPEIRQVIKIDEPGDEELREDPSIVQQLAISIYQHFHADMDDDFDSFTDELPPLPAYTVEELTNLDEAELFALVLANDDMLPMKVVQECAQRKEAMVPLLRQHLTEAANWHSDVDKSDWWALLHAIFILGLIPGEASAQALLGAFRRVNCAEHDSLRDWLSAYWPALCRNKTEYTTNTLRQLADDRDMRWYARSQAVDCVVAAEHGTAALDTALDWLAAMCGDESEDLEFRVISGHTLLDFPRERHRPVMVRLVALQKPGSLVENAFGLDEIDPGFDAGDMPEWLRFDNPWQFYDPDEILSRQKRWLREAHEEEMDLYGPDDREPPRTHVREHPKVGRNDPCPCGSGKKYKKCCMRTIH